MITQRRRAGWRRRARRSPRPIAARQCPFLLRLTSAAPPLATPAPFPPHSSDSDHHLASVVSALQTERGSSQAPISSSRFPPPHTNESPTARAPQSASASNSRPSRGGTRHQGDSTPSRSIAGFQATESGGPLSDDANGDVGVGIVPPLRRQRGASATHISSSSSSSASRKSRSSPPPPPPRLSAHARGRRPWRNAGPDRWWRRQRGRRRRSGRRDTQRRRRLHALPRHGRRALFCLRGHRQARRK